jgi:hypothetical protein
MDTSEDAVRFAAALQTVRRTSTPAALDVATLARDRVVEPPTFATIEPAAAGVSPWAILQVGFFVLALLLRLASC